MVHLPVGVRAPSNTASANTHPPSGTANNPVDANAQVLGLHAQVDRALADVAALREQLTQVRSQGHGINIRPAQIPDSKKVEKTNTLLQLLEVLVVETHLGAKEKESVTAMVKSLLKPAVPSSHNRGNDQDEMDVDPASSQCTFVAETVFGSLESQGDVDNVVAAGPGASASILALQAQVEKGVRELENKRLQLEIVQTRNVEAAAVLSAETQRKKELAENMFGALIDRTDWTAEVKIRLRAEVFRSLMDVLGG